MSKKDYIIIAASLLRTKPAEISAASVQHEFMCHAMANDLLAANDRFDCDKFLTACGYSNSLAL